MIALLDPSLQDHKGKVSKNLGDVIINKAVSRELSKLFPNEEIERISTHTYLEKKLYEIIKESRFCFIGGSNLLSSNIRSYNQWRLSSSRLYYLFPKLKEVILFGVGWWQYQCNPDLCTRIFYRKVLSKEYLHSVRDSYTYDKLKRVGKLNVVNTSCPTLWNLDGVSCDRRSTMSKDVLLTLTDYNQKPEPDTELIKVLLDYFTGRLYFFAQGSKDLDYLKSLEIYKYNADRFIILECLEEFYQILASNVIYIGTRLHGGIAALEEGCEALIISIDNRSKEIAKDVNIPVLDRYDYHGIRNWIVGSTGMGSININDMAIKNWRKQFK